MAHREGVRITPRQIATNLTLEMQQLVEQKAFVPIAPELSLDLCNDGPLNLVGALLTAKNISKYLGFMEETECEPNPEVSEPIMLSPKMIISGSTVLSGTLHKNLCGHTKAGVVITGPLSGMLVTESQFLQSEKTPVSKPIRVFNDQIIPLDPINFHPYCPYFIKKRMSGISPPTDMETLNRLYQEFKNDYAQYVQTVRMKFGKLQVSVREVFFNLCKDLQIPVDEKVFHYTMPVNMFERIEL